MAVGFSQHGTSTHPQLGSPSNGTLVLPSVANGDTILLVVVSTTGQLSSMSGCGATWTLLQISSGDVSGATAELWMGRVGTASGSTISFSNPGNVILDAVADTFTGATQGAIDSTMVVKAATSATSGTVLGSSSKPFEAGQAVVTFLLYDAFGNTFGSGTPSGGYTDSPSAWTTVDEYAASSNNVDIDSAYKITTGAGTYSRQASISSANTFSNDSVAFTVLLSPDPFPAPPPKASVIQAAALSRAANW